MTNDELESFSPKEQSKAGASRMPAQDAVTNSPGELGARASIRGSGAHARAADSPPSPAPRAPDGAAYTRLPAGRRPTLSGRGLSFARVRGSSPVVFAFAAGVAGAFLLALLVAGGVAAAYSGRAVPGVKVGSVDVSGLNRQAIVDKLQSAYAYLGQGEVTLTTPVGATTITYQQIGRSPDVQAMADAALSVGHGGNLISDGVSAIHSLVAGQSVPVVIQIDPMALAVRIHQLVATSALPPQNAQVALKSDSFTISPSSTGRGIDEKAVSTSIIDALTLADAPADLQAGGSFVTLTPQVDDTAAQAAIAAAQKMIVNITLTWGGAWPTPSSSPAASQPAASPTPTPAPVPTRTFTVDAQTVRSWIVFGTRPGGSYGPAADSALVQAYLSTLVPKVRIAPVEPTVITDSDGQPIGLKAGKDGLGIDIGATAQSIEAYLDSLVSGGNPSPSVAMTIGLIPPTITSVDNLSQMVVIGSWTTTFFPSESNGNGVNIRLPAKLLNGQVVGSGQQFSFLNAVGPIDAAHGWTLGGVIVGGKSEHTGAIGGGICSASTTMFNAAARAGLQIDERHAHFYYINRYPVGLDATVYSNGSEVWDLKWTNDTPYPIVIRAYSTYGSQSKVTMELWSSPLNRKVAFSGGVIVNQVKATDNPPQYVSTLKPGQTYVADYATDGFQTSVTRVVTDQSGSTIHTDTWKSSYTAVNGQVQIGGSPPPSQTPSPSPGAPTPVPSRTPAPTPTPAATLPPAPSPSPSARRRPAR